MIDEKKLLDDLNYYISHTREDSGEHYAYVKCKELIERQPVIEGSFVKIEQAKSGKEIHFKDCNKCKWLNMTEEEQGLAVSKPHFCEFYNKRIYHRSQELIHSGYLWPCHECTRDEFTNFKERE